MRSYQLSFWVKPVNLAATPVGNKRSFLWIGSGNATVLSFYRQDGNNTIEVSANTEQCEQTIHLPDNEWTWVTIHWKMKSYGSKLVHLWVFNNTINATTPATCSSVTRDKTGIAGRIVFGAEAVDHHDGPYQSHINMEVDDVMLKDTYIYVHPSWSSVKSSGHRTDYNWIGEPRYLYNVTPPDLYRKLIDDT